jgi:Dihydrodipicolinate reductase, C-terminus
MWHWSPSKEVEFQHRTKDDEPEAVGWGGGLPQVVAFQAMMEVMGQQFPGAFSGYKLEVTESHQRTKVDTSGTAKDVIRSFNRLGVPFEEVPRSRSRSRAAPRAPAPARPVAAAAEPSLLGVFEFL